MSSFTQASASFNVAFNGTLHNLVEVAEIIWCLFENCNYKYGSPRGPGKRANCNRKLDDSRSVSSNLYPCNASRAVAAHLASLKSTKHKTSGSPPGRLGSFCTSRTSLKPMNGRKMCAASLRVQSAGRPSTKRVFDASGGRCSSGHLVGGAHHVFAADFAGDQEGYSGDVTKVSTLIKSDRQTH